MPEKKSVKKTAPKPKAAPKAKAKAVVKEKKQTIFRTGEKCPNQDYILISVRKKEKS